MTTVIKPIADYLEVKGRFKRSVHLEKDYNNSMQNGEYILTPTARAVIKRFADGMAGMSSCRAWTLTGPYGVGKSAFAVFLTRLFCSQDKQGKQARHQLQSVDPNLYEHLTDLGVLKVRSRGFLPILATARRTSAPKCLAEGIVAAAASSAEKKIKSSIRDIKRLVASAAQNQQWDTRPIVNTLVSLSESAHDVGYAGILLIVDELGKLFEYAARYPLNSDVFILQEMAEQAARSSKHPMVVVGLLHQSFEEYGQHLDIGTRREWAKIQGRFEDIAFLEPVDQVITMIASSIRWDPDTQKPARQRVLRRTAAIASKSEIKPPAMKPSDFEEVARAVYPIHPATLVALPFLFRRFAQNERSLFSYLNSLEPHRFKKFNAEY